jgi:hypothetical protein
MFAFDEAAHGQEEVGSGKGAESSMKGEGRSKSPTGQSRPPVATVEDSSPGQVPEARFADLFVPKEGGRKAEQTKVVQRHHNSSAFFCSHPKDRGREGGEKIVAVHDLDAVAADVAAQRCIGTGRPDSFHARAQEPESRQAVG